MSEITETMERIELNADGSRHIHIPETKVGIWIQYLPNEDFFLILWRKLSKQIKAQHITLSRGDIVKIENKNLQIGQIKFVNSMSGLYWEYTAEEEYRNINGKEE